MAEDLENYDLRDTPTDFTVFTEGVEAMYAGKDAFQKYLEKYDE